MKVMSIIEIAKVVVGVARKSLSHARCGGWMRAALLGSFLLAAPTASAGIETFQELQAVRSDGRQLVVSDFVLERDVFRFEFTGTFELFSPVAGRVPGALFEGRGRFVLDPATSDERRHLELVTGEKSLETLSDTFERMVLLFGDGTEKQILEAGKVVSGNAVAEKTMQVFREFGKPSRDIATRLHSRLLRDYLGESDAGGVFMALFRGKIIPHALATVDPLGAEELFISAGLGGEEVALYVDDRYEGGFWYLNHLREEIAAGTTESCRPRSSADALHYDVATTLAKDDRLSATTTIRFRAQSEGIQVLPFWLTTRLRITSAAIVGALGEERALPFFQEDLEVKVDHLANGMAAVILPEPMQKGQEATIAIRYAGEHVLVDAGEGNYYVRARTSWYPSVRIFGDRATYRLIFHLPPKMEVIAVGDLVEHLQTEEMNISIWESDVPLLVAGFNYGMFDKIEHIDETSGLALEVYTNPGVPDFINEMNYANSMATENRPLDIVSPAVGGFVRINTADLAESAMADAANSAMFFSTLLGPIPQKRIAITQQSQWSFGQSWPTLIFLPYLAFVDSTNRESRSGAFVQEVGLHEMAHQWWGHLVGWESYRDAWLSEGFAEFSTAFLLQQTHGWEAYRIFWERRQNRLLARNRGGLGRNFEVGPISRGRRLQTSRSEYAFQPIVYGKGGFVLHMLRMMMFDEKSKVPDARFVAMLRDFVATYAGKSASTDDFKAIVEKHMTASMNATQDGKMDWFFDQWVHGTEIPSYSVDVSISRAGRKGYRLKGRISQEGVSPDFKAIVPLYVELKKGPVSFLGRARFSGVMSQDFDVTLELPSKPRRVLVNAHYDVLSQD